MIDFIVLYRTLEYYVVKQRGCKSKRTLSVSKSDLVSDQTERPRKFKSGKDNFLGMGTNVSLGDNVELCC